MIWEALLLIGLAFGYVSPSGNDCRQIHIVPFVTKQGDVDPFELTTIVKNHFQQLGFDVVAGLATTSNPSCEYYQCAITHTENYWKFKRDTVCLTITDRQGKLIGRYCGASGKTALTFKSGYSTATNKALISVQESSFH